MVICEWFEIPLGRSGVCASANSFFVTAQADLIFIIIFQSFEVTKEDY